MVDSQFGGIILEIETKASDARFERLNGALHKVKQLDFSRLLFNFATH